MSALPLLPFDAIPAEVDAVVIGGGLAGGMAALRLASAGFRTVVFDRTAHPREKVCGCCLAPSGIAVLSRCGLAGLLADASPLEEVLLEAERGAAVVRRPGSVAIARGTLDVRLLAAASAAGALIACPVSAAVDGSGGVELRHGGAVRHVRARIVVAADGLHGSSLARRGDFAWKSSERSLIGVGAIVPAG
ncbi:MAG: FAD-binding protein, partial [Proteobacteria bacterium]|nr:FAD-binding protein [Pseudomonadota bacterium]